MELCDCSHGAVSPCLSPTPWQSEAATGLHLLIEGCRSFTANCPRLAAQGGSSRRALTFCKAVVGRSFTDRLPQLESCTAYSPAEHLYVDTIDPDAECV
jgi:hypothetical protein